MKILLDESVPVQVRAALQGHSIATVAGLGWKGRVNGELLAAAEQAGFDIFIIADKNLRYQQDLRGLHIALVQLWTNHRPTLEGHFKYIASFVEGATPGKYVIVPKP